MATAMAMDTDMDSTRIAAIRDAADTMPKMKWSRGLIVTALCMLLAFFASRFAFESIAASAASSAAVPDWASTPAALNSRGEAILSSQQPLVAKLQSLRPLALASLQKQAINPVALRLLEVTRSLDTQNGSHHALLDLSMRVSRRDFGTQLWIIERSVEQGDSVAALRAYNTALSTTSQSWDLLFPILTAALDDPEIRSAFVPYLKRQSVWIAPFFAQAVSTTTNPRSLAELAVQAGGLKGLKNAPDLQRALFSALIDKRQFGALKDSFRALQPSDVSLLTSAKLNRRTLSFENGRLSWQLSSDPALSASTSAANTLVIYAGSGERGTAATKLLFLPQGSYQLKADIGRSGMSNSGYLQWRLTCPNQPEGLTWEGRATRPVSGTTLVESISLPAKCETQLLELVAGGGNEQQGAEVEVRSIDLQPLAPGS